MSERERFEGRIAGVGRSIGVRVVVGSWRRSPYGRFADVMLAEPDGIRWRPASRSRTSSPGPTPSTGSRSARSP